MDVLVEGNRSYPIISDVVKLDPKNHGDLSKEKLFLKVISNRKSKRPNDPEFDAISVAVVKTIMEVKQQSNGATYGWFESAEYEYYRIEDDGPFVLCLAVYSDPDLDAATQQRIHQELSDEIFAAIEAEDDEKFDHKASVSRLYNAVRLALRKFRKVRKKRTITVQRAEVTNTAEGSGKPRLTSKSTTLPTKELPKTTAYSFEGPVKIVGINCDSMEVTFRDVSSDSEDVHPDMVMKAKSEMQFDLLNVACASKSVLGATFSYKEVGGKATGTLKKDSIELSTMDGQTIRTTVGEGGYKISTLLIPTDAGNDDTLLDDLG